MSLLRTRWSAVGAAVALALGAGGIGLVSATNPADATTFVAITPCRVIDTRPEFNVGPNSSPLGVGEIHTVKTHGSNGNCTGIPVEAVAISMNMTTVGATAPTFLTVWAADAPQPEASSLNPTPGAPPTPNAVTTELNGAGEFNIYNLAGNVHVLADINGYYVDHDHDDRYYTKAQIDERPGAVEWINVQPQATIRSTSAGLDGATVVRPPGEPAGFYCIKFPAGANLSGEAAIGSIQQSTTLIEGRTISVTTIWANSCFVVGVEADIAVEIFDSSDVRTDSGFVVFVPQGFP